MKDNLIKIILRVIAYDVMFLILLRLALILIPHKEQQLIYYVNLNFHFIIACLAWMNFKQSKINKLLILIFGLYYTSYLIIVLFYIFSSSLFPWVIGYTTYHIAWVYANSYQLLITFFVFFLSLYPYKENKYYLHLSIFFTLLISTVLYAPIFVSGEYLIDEMASLFVKSYYIFLINFSLLVVFWHQYTKTKLIFSEMRV